MLALEKPFKSVYLRLKWLVYQHYLITNYEYQSPLFQYTLKALLLYSENFDELAQGYGPYEHYLTKILVKPYLQYLSKLCLLRMPDGANNGENSEPMTK